MTTYSDLSQLARITPEELKILRATTGILKITVLEVDGYYLPMIHHTPPDGESEFHGFIMDGENILATVELADIPTALEEVLGTQNYLLNTEIPEGVKIH